MITIIILSICLAVSIFININLLRKTEAAQDELIDTTLTVEDMITDINRAYIKIKEIDSKGVFESDDEVGSVFSGISDIIEKLNDKYSLGND